MFLNSQNFTSFHSSLLPIFKGKLTLVLSLAAISCVGGWAPAPEGVEALSAGPTIQAGAAGTLVYIHPTVPACGAKISAWLRIFEDAWKL